MPGIPGILVLLAPRPDLALASPLLHFFIKHFCFREEGSRGRSEAGEVVKPSLLIAKWQDKDDDGVCKGYGGRVGAFEVTARGHRAKFESGKPISLA